MSSCKSRGVPALVAALLCVSCSGGMPQAQSSMPPLEDAGVRLELTAAEPHVFVGDRTSLTPVFDGEEGAIDGIGFVQSGVAVQTPPLARTTTFTLRVSRGYGEVQAQATVQASYRNRIRVLHGAPLAQSNHVAAPLPDGRAIVMGGNTSDAPLVPDSLLTQVFDPATEQLTPGPDLLFAAQAGVFTSAVPLTSGGFLLPGTGPNAPVGALRSVLTQAFDPQGPSGFVRVGDVSTRGISARTATALAAGGALLSGGLANTTDPVSDSADRYDPAHAAWRAVGPMNHVRTVHTATLLRDGRVLLAGGLTCCQVPNPSAQFYSATAEIYDPATDVFTPTGSMHAARGNHAAALLPDGRVLISGGDADPAAAPLATEIFDPVTGTFTLAGDLRAPRDSHAAVPLTDGRILVIGGEVPPFVARAVGVGVTGTEIFDPATGQWTAGPDLNPAFYTATVTLLSNGKVLVFGGQDPAGFPQNAAALFE